MGRRTRETALAVAPRVRPAKIEIPLTSAPAYIPGSGPRSEPIRLTPVKDSTAYIIDKYVLPKLADCGPTDRRLLYYLVGFTDLPVVRILIPCHKALDYVDPFEIEQWEGKNDEKLAEDRKRLKEEAAKGRKRAGRPAKGQPQQQQGTDGGVNLVPALATEPDYSKPPPHSSHRSISPSSSSPSHSFPGANEQQSQSILLDTQLAGPSLSTPQKRKRPSPPSQHHPVDPESLSKPSRLAPREEQAIRRQLFWESTNKRLSPSYSPTDIADNGPAGRQPSADMGERCIGPSPGESTTADQAVQPTTHRRRRRQPDQRPASAASSGSAAGTGSGTPQIHPDWAQIMKFSNKVMDIMDEDAPKHHLQPGNTGAASRSGGFTATNAVPVALHPSLPASVASSWGGDRFPLPTAEGFLPNTPPAPGASGPSAKPKETKKRSAKDQSAAGQPQPNKKRRRSATPKTPKQKESDEELWEVKHLLADEVRYSNGKRCTYYLVRWTGDYPPSWEPASNIEDKDLIKTYRDQKRKGTLPPMPPMPAGTAGTPSYASVDEAFRGGIHDDHNDQNLEREDEPEEEDELLAVIDPLTTPFPGMKKKAKAKAAKQPATPTFPQFDHQLQQYNLAYPPA